MERVVLVVDEETSVRSRISDSLREHGYRAIETTDGSTALRLVRELGPAAVVLEVGLPGLDGCAVLETLRSDPTTRPLPVIGMSDGDVDPADARSFTCFLRKPFQPGEVAFVLAQLDTGQQPA